LKRKFLKEKLHRARKNESRQMEIRTIERWNDRTLGNESFESLKSFERLSFKNLHHFKHFSTTFISSCFCNLCNLCCLCNIITIPAKLKIKKIIETHRFSKTVKENINNVKKNKL
jgi:hypothetical protein